MVRAVGIGASGQRWQLSVRNGSDAPVYAFVPELVYHFAATAGWTSIGPAGMELLLVPPAQTTVRELPDWVHERPEVDARMPERMLVRFRFRDQAGVTWTRADDGALTGDRAADPATTRRLREPVAALLRRVRRLGRRPDSD